MCLGVRVPDGTIFGTFHVRGWGFLVYVRLLVLV